MYGDDAQNNPLLLTSLLVEALANANNTVATTATLQAPASLQTSAPTSLFQPNGLQNTFIPTTQVSLNAQIQNVQPNFASLLLNQQQIPQSAPNPVVDPNQMLLNQTALNQMLLLNTALQQDILRLSQDTGSFQINDDGSESSRSATAVPPPISSASFTNPQLSVFEAPLDLTMRKLPTHVEEEQQPSTSRPTVIKNGFPPKPPRLEPTTRSCGVKRSTSSLSYRPAPDPDVSDHFRRSLSGKWPRRPANYSHYTINNGGRLDSNSASQQSISSNSTRVTSPSIQRRQGGSNSCLYQTIIGEEEVEDHFRRTFELLRQNADVKNKTADTTSTRL